MDARDAIDILRNYDSGNAEALETVLDELEYYIALEKKGHLIKIPCAVGDTVYQIDEGFVEPCTVEVIFIADYKDKDGNNSYMAEIHYDRDDCPYVSTEIYLTDIGKTVFLTRAGADAARKEEK